MTTLEEQQQKAEPARKYEEVKICSFWLL